MKLGGRTLTTVFDVAKKAGVSIATVSRVLRGTAIVSEETRSRVVQAVEELGYFPNRMAQGLRLGRTETVAFAVGDIEQSVYAAMTKHLQSALEHVGLDLMLYNLGHSESRLMKLLDSAPTLGVRAVVVASSDALPLDGLLQRTRLLTDIGIAVVAINQDLSSHGIPSVVYDDKGAARKSVSYLIATSNGPVAYLGRIAGSAVGSNRFAGFAAAHEEADVRFDADLVWDASYRYPAGYESVARACREQRRFGAIQAGSDELAMGAMAALQDMGRRVPQDCKVVGFGGADWGEHARPALATLTSSPEEMSAHIAAIFQDLNARLAPPLLTVMERKFVRRDSA
jgi:DNA-binding LacI/PurR family transcriptional regulator